MLLHFYKMNGAGNDFVAIDNRALDLPLSRQQIALLCDRHRGVGADGLLAVEPAEQGADFRFRYYNADGGEAEMCGNGARCFGRFTSHLLPEVPDQVTFETIAGILAAEIVGENIRVAMSDPFDLHLDTGATVDDLDAPIHSLNTGVPHAVAFVDDIEPLDIRRLGAAIRHHDHFAPAGTNANFAQVLAPGHLAIRTYERGVEDETLACGTGMVACALLHHLLDGAPSPIQVDVRGGDTLEIGFHSKVAELGPVRHSFSDGGRVPADDASIQISKVTLTGPADFVFEGDIEIP